MAEDKLYRAYWQLRCDYVELDKFSKLQKILDEDAAQPKKSYWRNLLEAWAIADTPPSIEECRRRWAIRDARKI